MNEGGTCQKKKKNAILLLIQHNPIFYSLSFWSSFLHDFETFQIFSKKEIATLA